MNDVPPPPPPPPPPGGGTPGPPPSSSGGDLDVGAAVSFGWNSFTSNIAPWLIAMLAIVAAVIVGYIVGFIVMIVLANINEWLGLVGWGLMFGLIFLAQFVASYGLVNGALQASRGETPTLGSMWEMSRFGNYALTSILVGVIVTIGYMLCYIPGIIAAFFLILAPWLAIDQGTKPVDAIKESYQRVLAKIGPFFLLWIVTALIMAVGYMICGIGAFVSVPVGLIAFGHGYRQLRLDLPAS